MILSLRAFPRCVNHYLKQSQLHTSAKLLIANDPSSLSSSSSSSSDSSDSDSDKDDKIGKKQIKEINNSDDLSPESRNDRLNKLLFNIAEASKVKKAPNLKVENNEKKEKSLLTPGMIDVSIKHRRLRFKKSESEKKKVPIEKQITGAAKEVAKCMGDNTGKTETELLDQILNLRPNVSTEKKTETSEKVSEQPTLTDLLSNMKVDKPSTSYQDYRQEQAKKVQERLQNSIASSLLQQKSKKGPQRKANLPTTDIELNAPCSKLHIFKTLPKNEPQNIPQLLIWEEMEKREMKLATLITPQNIFQELMQWTDQGKLWHFPINNEQGMEEEEKVHFSEHVFLERHLKGWCPKKGPIRNFMELVCIGLSKNPYMTVEEKIGHITWYKNYFEERKDLLIELGAFDIAESPAEKQITA